MEYVLKTNSLCKNYGHFKALNGLSMNVPKGSIYGLIGKNGAGKTTLIRLICGLQEPTSGDYVLYGKKHIDKDITKSRRRMGAIVETPSIYVDLTAYENLKEQYKVLGIPSDDGISEILKLVGLENTGNKKTKNFSPRCNKTTSSKVIKAEGAKRKNQKKFFNLMQPFGVLKSIIYERKNNPINLKRRKKL